MKNKKLNIIILILKNLLPVTRFAMRKNDGDMLKLLHAQTELMMLNRHDIMTLSAGVAAQYKKDVLQKTDIKKPDNMYG